jgi:cytochrome c oxidase subunit 3
VFLATEVLFFGALFTAFAHYRWALAEGFAAGARHMELLLGSLNTAVLLTSSFTMAAAVHRAQSRRYRETAWWLAATWLLGAAFLSIKGLEYARHVQDGLWPGPSFDWKENPALAGPARMYFAFYFCMTGLHAIHMLVGLVVVAVVGALCWTGKLEEVTSSAAVENTGLYWHFVDIVWIWLYPCFYLLTKTR